MTDKKITEKILEFLKHISIPVQFESIEKQTFMPGMAIKNGCLIIDTDKLLYPGDLLHEAGHIAVVSAGTRKNLNDDLDTIQFDEGHEMAAIAWSYAACKYLDIDAHIVFHEHGYKGAGESIVANFNEGRYFGVPLLQWYGMTSYNPKDLEADSYPNMINWLST